MQKVKAVVCTGKKNNDYSFMAYDVAFRTLETECDDALICFVNYMFNEKYDRTAKVVRLRNEHFVENQGKPDEKRVTDSHFRIIFHGIETDYQLECESSGYSRTLLVRLFQYAVESAIDGKVETSRSKIVINIPKGGLLVLRNEGSPPEKVAIEIKTPGGAVAYNVPVVCEADYTLDELFEKKLYFMIPFYFFNLEEKLAICESDPEALKEFENLYCGIIDRIGEIDEAELSLRSKGVIIRQMEKVSKRLADKKKNVREKVGEIMEIQSERWEWLDRFDAAVEGGREEGRQEGRAEGEERHLIKMVCKKLRKGKEVWQIANELEEDEVRIQVICDAAEAFAPEYDEEKVFEAVGVAKTLK